MRKVSLECGVCTTRGEVDSSEGGVVAMGGIGRIEAMVAKALVLGDSNASFLKRIVRIIKGGNG